ncbi:T9SS type A sorting domain-containing protein [Flavobacterium sp. 5]|uniref:T9SS type A sorting domain-containing protein n=1 Tax=Flavobacterium sp. 5 TaxID=2035199 RepID=UPI000C2B68B4|nr:T9SS type A sorting domain-containing protein [Flavobacterium sp. 5]PKB15635.1 hypothetical protein CLU82_0720 [Flavobacterium sp. 5]
MKKIILFTIKSMQEYCISFSCLLRTGISKFNFTIPLNQSFKLWSTSWLQSLALPIVFLGFLMISYTTVHAQNIKGIVPVSSPAGGDAIDGDFFAHQPIGTNFEKIGDLFDDRHNPSSPAYDPNNPTALHNLNHGLIDPVTGNVLNKPLPETDPPTPQNVPVTYQIKDRYIDDLTIFTLSNKINDNPNTYTWGAGTSPNKNEIQNCGAHFSYGDPAIKGGVTNMAGTFISPTPAGGVSGLATDLWCMFAGDRQVTNGSSYIDFEFLQAPLTMTGATFGPVDPFTGVAPISGGSGKFVSAAPDATGGRTVGDILITIEFTQGGGDANVVIRQWQKVGSAYEYVVIPNTTFPGFIFCTNNNVTTTVPFEAYGTNPGVYVPNQWAEGAINLTQVLTALHNPCTSISTLFIRTRSSGSSAQSELKDFPGAPIQLNLDFTPNANAGADFAKTCISNPDGKEIGQAPEVGFTYSWSPSTGLSATNIANPIANPTETTTYTVTKTKASTGCSDTDQVTVTVNKPPVVAVAGSDFTKTCTTNPNGGNIGEVAVTGFTYSWTSSPAGFTSTSANPLVNPSVTTTYTVTKTHTTSGCSDTDDVIVTVNKPTVVANAGDDFTKNCLINISGGSIGEAAMAGYTYSWTSSPVGFTSTDANPFVNPSVTTTYTVTKTHTDSGCSDTDEVTVTVNKPTVVAVAGDDFTKNCLMNISGGSIGEAAAIGYTYSWTSSPVGFTSTDANPSVNPSVTTTYTVTKTHTASGCSDTDDVTVTVNKPDVTANAGTDFTKNCLINISGGSIGEASAEGFTYSWTSSPAGFTSTDANPSVNPSVTTTYTVTKTHTASGCSDTDEVTVTVNKPTVVAVAGDDFTKNCLMNISGGSIGEASAEGFTYSWTSSPAGFTSTDANPSVNPSVTTTYTVTKTHTASGCSDTDDVTVTVNKPDVTANAGSDFTKNCLINISGSSIGEASAEGYTYSWTSSPVGFTSTDANPSVNPSVTTTYTVTKTHTASGCSDTDEVTVTVNKPTVVAVAGDDFTKNCLMNISGGSIGEASAEGYTYSWTSSPAGFTSTDANPFVNPSVTTTYTVTKTHTASGCSDTDEVTVTVNKPDVTANAGTDFTKNCLMNISGGSIGEASAEGYTYSWTSSPAGFTSTDANPSVNPSVTTTYTVTKTHTASGCSDTDEVTVTVNKPTVVAVAGDDFTKNCLINMSGGSIGEASAEGYTYSWTSSPAGFTSTDANPFVNPSVTTTYTVTKTHTASGCSDTDEVTVTVNKPTVVAVAGDDFTKNCSMNSNGGSIGEAAAIGYTYSWTSSPAGFTSTDANPSVNPSVTTTYTVTKTHTASGCSDTDEVTVTVNKPDVTANAGSDFTKNCLINISGGSIGEAAVIGYTYSWTSSPVGFTSTDANPSVNPSVTTTYTVTKTHTASGCSDTDDVTVTVNKPTVVAVAGDDFTKNCLMNISGGSIGEASAEGYTYSWTSSPAGFTSTDANPSVNPSVTTTYTVTKTHTASGCSDTDEVTVTVNKPDVTANAGSDFTKNCLINISGGSIGEAAAIGYTYSWTSSPAGFTSTDANPFVNPSVTTTYTVTKTHTASGCSDTDEVTVTVNKPTIVAVAGDDFTKNCLMNISGGSIGEASAEGYTYSWTSSPAGFTSTDANPSVNPSVTTTYTVTKTHSASGCSDTDEVTVTVNKPDVTANAGSDFTKNCLINISGGSIGEAAAIGYTYSWTSSPVGFTSTDANPFVNPSVTTTYTVTKTHTASGCNDTDEVTVTVNKPTVVAVAGDDFTKNCLINISGGSIGEASAEGYTYSWTSSPAGFTSTNANPSVNPSVTTTYTVTKTHTASGCSDTDEVTVTVNKPTVVAGAGSDFTITCKLNISGGSIGEAAQVGYTYSWTSSPAGFTSTNANPFVNPSVTTTYTVTKTHTASGCSDTDEVTVTVNNTNPTALSVKSLEICYPIPVSLLSALVSALPDPNVISVTFWTDAAATTSQVTNLNFSGTPGVHVFYVKEEVLATGCISISQFSVDVKSCIAALCTYTQGYYGNPGGTSCAEGKPYTTAGLIAKALASYGGTMTIGSNGNTVWMKAPEDIDDIIRVMPGGGGSYVLSGSYEISNLPNSYLKKGKINNTLLAQTIALGLNIGINGALGNLELKAGTFAVAEPEGGCGSDVPKTRQCSPGGYTPVINEYKYYSIPANVINAISPKTVQGLFALANQALGGGSTNGLTLSQIASAVDLINNAFDQCRIFVGYNVEPLICATPIESLIIDSSTSRIADTSSFTASPVPFKDQLTISYDYKFVTDVKIEAFNSLGLIVASSYDANGYLNKQVTLNIPSTGQAELYIIKVTTNKGSSTQKVLSTQ